MAARERHWQHKEQRRRDSNAESKGNIREVGRETVRQHSTATRCAAGRLPEQEVMYVEALVASTEASVQTSRMVLPGWSPSDPLDRFHKGYVMAEMMLRGELRVYCRALFNRAFIGEHAVEWVAQTFGGVVDEIIYVDDHLEVKDQQEVGGSGTGSVRTGDYI